MYAVVLLIEGDAGDQEGATEPTEGTFNYSPLHNSLNC